jgi:hypothetical protein
MVFLCDNNNNRGPPKYFYIPSLYIIPKIPVKTYPIIAFVKIISHPNPKIGPTTSVINDRHEVGGKNLSALLKVLDRLGADDFAVLVACEDGHERFEGGCFDGDLGVEGGDC